jgi:hypothetical protein
VTTGRSRGVEEQAPITPALSSAARSLTFRANRAWRAGSLLRVYPTPSRGWQRSCPWVRAPARARARTRESTVEVVRRGRPPERSGSMTPQQPAGPLNRHGAPAQERWRRLHQGAERGTPSLSFRTSILFCVELVAHSGQFPSGPPGRGPFTRHPLYRVTPTFCSSTVFRRTIESQDSRDVTEAKNKAVTSTLLRSARDGAHDAWLLRWRTRRAPEPRGDRKPRFDHATTR